MPALILLWFMLLPSIGHAEEDEYLAYFREANVEVHYVKEKTTSALGQGYEIRAAYGHQYDKGLEAQVVGVFLTRSGRLVEIIDMVPSEREMDFFPSITVVDESHAVISFVSDYGELAKREYIFDLTKDKKLLKIVRLQAAGIPDDLP